MTWSELKAIVEQNDLDPDARVYLCDGKTVLELCTVQMLPLEQPKPTLLILCTDKVFPS